MGKRCLDCGGEFNKLLELILEKAESGEKFSAVICGECGLVHFGDNGKIVIDEDGLKIYLVPEDMILNEDIFLEEKMIISKKQILH